MHRIPGLILKDHTFQLPLDYSKPNGEKIKVFAREVVATAHEKDNLPWLVYLQGGPGFGAPRPADSSGWLKRALQEYRVLLLDQRGTGRSTPILPQTLIQRGSPQEQAAYMMHFRADAIVKDAEMIRRKLLGEQGRWTLLGQSYGGFCAVHYLSVAPDSLGGVILTGGLAPITRPIDDVYRHTYQEVLRRNRLYYERYPEDVALVQAIVTRLAAEGVTLPAGGQLTPRRFQQLGIAFGAKHGFEKVHYLLERAFVDGKEGRELSYFFLCSLENEQAFETNPIYVLLHEPIYCEGYASNWSAERVRSEFPSFAIQPGEPVYFTGEMVYSWMMDDYGELRTLKKAANILANYANWQKLYDTNVLNRNTVPVAAALYYNDMYVARELSLETAAEIKGIRLWITNEHEHDGIRMDGEVVLGRLLGMIHGDL